MGPLHAADMQNTTMDNGIFRQTATKPPPHCFRMRYTVNPAVKCCRSVEKDILRHWKDADLWWNNTFTFRTLNALRAPVSFAAFYPSGAFFPWNADWSFLSFHPRQPNNSFFAFIALYSFRANRSFTSNRTGRSSRAGLSGLPFLTL